MTPILGIIASSKPAKPTVTGGTLTSDATYYYRTFTGSGTLTVSNANLAISYLVVGGGGSGNYLPGGGAGGYIATTGTLSPASYTATVGGAASASTFNSQTANGGSTPGDASSNGGTSGSPTTHTGGVTLKNPSNNPAGGGGGGGSSANGSPGTFVGVDYSGGLGGAGTTWINGTTYAAGGGGAGTWSGSPGDNSSGLLGNGGNGQQTAAGYTGQQGIVIVAYLKTAV
jgi:hypothetical protein